MSQEDYSQKSKEKLEQLLRGTQDINEAKKIADEMTKVYIKELLELANSSVSQDNYKISSNTIKERKIFDEDSEKRTDEDTVNKVPAGFRLCPSCGVTYSLRSCPRCSIVKKRENKNIGKTAIVFLKI